MAAVDLRKKQCQEISDANLANQLKKVPALNANDSLLQATQVTDLDHEDKEEDNDKMLEVTKYFTMPVWPSGSVFLREISMSLIPLSQWQFTLFANHSYRLLPLRQLTQL